jgi:hypothetical protein
MDRYLDAPDRFCMHLSLGFDPTMHPAFDPFLRDRSLRSSWHCSIPPDHMDPRITVFLSGINAWSPHAEVFYSLPGLRRPIHTDGGPISDLCKINWVYGGSGSLMRWWDPKDPTKAPKEGRTIVGSRYCSYDDDDCELAWESTVGFPSLVQVGIPHDMVNSSDEPRWCVSYVVSDATTREPIPWDRAVERFSGFKA